MTQHLSSMRVLLAAYQCGPGLGSVSQIGWEWYARLSAQTSVTLLTHTRNRAALTAAGAPLHGSEVVYVDTEWFAGPLYRLAAKLFPHSEHAVFLISSLDFFVYERAARRLLQRGRKPQTVTAQSDTAPSKPEHEPQSTRWDVVHAVTPVSPSAPTRLDKLGVPLVWGPLNGGLASPAHFPDIMRADAGWVYRVRGLGRGLERLLGTTRRAAAVLTATRSTDAALPANVRPKTQRMLENGVDLTLFQPTAWPAPPNREHALQVLFVGRLIPCKGLEMLLEAVRRVRAEGWPVRLTVAGDGPMRGAWEAAAQHLNIADDVNFLGAQPLAEVARLMSAAHVFCLPSVRESGGAVLLEAMAAARPFIAVNYGGPAELLDAETSWALPPDGPAALIDSLTDALRDVFAHPAQWQQRGLNGRARAEQTHGWDAKIKTALQIYQRVASSK